MGTADAVVVVVAVVVTVVVEVVEVVGVIVAAVVFLVCQKGVMIVLGRWLASQERDTQGLEVTKVEAKLNSQQVLLQLLKNDKKEIYCSTKSLMNHPHPPKRPRQVVNVNVSITASLLVSLTHR